MCSFKPTEPATQPPPGPAQGPEREGLALHRLPPVGTWREQSGVGVGESGGVRRAGWGGRQEGRVGVPARRVGGVRRREGGEAQSPTPCVEVAGQR